MHLDLALLKFVSIAFSPPVLKHSALKVVTLQKFRLEKVNISKNVVTRLYMDSSQTLCLNIKKM